MPPEKIAGRFAMAEKLSLEDLKERVKEFEKEVAEHKKPEEELRLHSEILNQMAEGVYLIRTSDGVIVYANEMFESMFGYDHGELVGKHVSIVNAPNERIPEEVSNEIIQSLNEDGTWSGEVHNIKKDGTLFWCYANVSTFDHHEFGRVWVAVHEDISDRKEAEKKLSNSLQRAQYLADIVRDASVGIGDGYPDGGVGLCNNAFQQLTGYSEEELKRINWTEVLTPPQWREYEIAKLEELDRTKRPVHYEKEYIRKDGSRVHAELVVHPRLGDDGNVESYFAFITDITQRKQAQDALRNAHEELEQRVEERTAKLLKVNEQLKLEIEERKQAQKTLRESEEKYRQLFESLQEGIWGIDKDAYTTFVNPRMAEMLGYTVDEMTGRHLFEFMDERGIEICKVNLAKREKGIKEQHEFEFMHRDGSRVFTLIETYSQINSDGSYSGTVASVMDITKRKQAEKALRESEEKYRTQFEKALDAIFIADAETGIILDCNQAGSELVGRAKSELIGKQQRILHGPEEIEGEFNWTFKHHLREKEGQALETKLITKNGQTRDVAIKASIFELNGKKVVQGIFRDVTDEKQGRAEVETLKQRIEFILGVTKTGLDIIDSDYNIRYIDPEWAKVYGDPTGRKCYEYFMDQSDVCPVSGVTSAKETKSPTVTEEVLVKERNRPIQVTTIPFQNDKGEWLFAQINVDISERKRAEEALKEERNKAQKYLDIAGVMIVAVDAAGDVTLINKKGCEVLGYEQGEILGKSWFDNFLPERMRDEVKGVSLKLLGGEVEPAKYYENQVLTKNGQERLIAWHNTVLRDEAGDIIGHLSSGDDITERKQTEEALRASEQRYRTLLENLPQKIFHKDRDSVYVSCNETYASDLRIKPEEIKGKTDYDFFPQELAEKYRMDDQRIVTLGNTEEFEEKYFQNGQEMWIQTVKTPVKDGDGSITGVLGMFWDITEKKKAEEENNRLQAQLQQAQKMEAIGTLAGGIAHDFNNILAAIMGYTELVMEDVPEGSTAKSNLKEIFKAGIRARDLVGQILAFSRQSEHEQKPLQPTSIIKEALKLLRASLPTTIEIRQNIGGQSNTILADPTQIHRVLMNLCTNAAHAIQEKGGLGVLGVTLDDVDVDADAAAQHPDLKPGPYARLTVSDTGCGMDHTVLERAFDPFFTTKTVGKGTGMGLSVVHGIVKEHGGAILADSKPGKATTFQVFLPKIETQEAQHEAIGPLHTGNERILFVDDEKAVVAVGKKSLERLGYEVVAKTSSIEALEAFRAQPDKFDLVITDLTMPNMTGIELQKELVAIRQDIPVILCTGFGQTVSEENAKAMGIKQLIMKPFLKIEIAKTIRRVLDNPSALS
jgi:PAS domain S-box-containing protein